MSVMAATTATGAPRYMMMQSPSQLVVGGTALAPAVSAPQMLMAPAGAAGTGFSYVPPVVMGDGSSAMSAAGTMAVAPPPPQPPARLTEGLPDPNAIESQKAAYTKGLDEQLRQGAAILNQQLKQQMDQLHQLGEQQKQKYFVQVDHEIKSQELGLVQQFKEQLLMVQQAASQQKRILGQQATALLMEYNQKKAQEDLLMEEYQFAKSAFDYQIRFNQEFSTLQQQQAQATQAAVSQQQAVEQHAASAMAAIEEQRQQVAQQMAAQSKLVQSAENTAATAAAMYSPQNAAYAPQAQYATPMPTGYSMVTPGTSVPPVSATVSYTPAPATVTMPIVSYTPAPIMAQAPVTQVAYAPSYAATTFASA